MNSLSGVRIEISGWQHKGWRGVFYPPGLTQRRELEFASRQFTAMELNDQLCERRAYIELVMEYGGYRRST
jgi:hypothetical protein